MTTIPSTAIRILLESVDGILTPEELVEGSGRNVESLGGLRARVEWDTFIAIIERLEQRVTPAEFETIGRRIVRAPTQELLRKAAGALLSPRSLYVVGGRFLWPQMFPHILITLRDLPPRDIEFACELLPGHRGSAAFFRFMIPSLAVMPTLLGLPPADVSLETDGSRATYRMCPPASTSALSRVGRQVNAVLRAGTVSRELERQQAAVQESYQALLRSQDDFRSAMEQIPELVAIHRDGRILWVNRVLAERLGYDSAEDLVGVPVAEHVHPDDQRVLAERLRRPYDAGSTVSRVRAVRRDGQLILVELQPGIDVRFGDGPARLVIGRDVTERALLEERLMLSERLAAVSTLAAGVAHEISNPLAYVHLHLEIASREVDRLPRETDDAVRTHLRQSISTAREGVARANAIVRDMRMFSRAADDRTERSSLPSILEAAAALAGRRLAERACVVKEYRPVPAVLGNPGRLGQVFLNLLTNAFDAIAPGSPETNELRVRTFTSERGEAVVEIADTGGGIAPETLPRVFDPFFTTKPIGDGTGLGLAVCHHLVTAAGGSIQVESTLGRGTTVRVTLPAHPDEPPSAPGPASQRLLLVGDETTLVREVLPLLAEGRDVTAVGSIRKAIDLAAASAFDAILCDPSSTDLEAVELYRALDRRSPDLPRRLVFLAGERVEPDLRRFIGDVGLPFLARPLDRAALDTALRRAAGDA